MNALKDDYDSGIFENSRKLTLELWEDKHNYTHKVFHSSVDIKIQLV